MRNSENVLCNLTNQAENPSYRFTKLISNLYNKDFYYKAIGNLYANKGAGTVGSDGKSIDGFSDEDIDKLIHSIKEETFNPTVLKRIYIPKKNGKKRPLSIPTFKDKLVQEIIRMILESIYEPKFSDLSHGFRPNRSCHTALKHINVNFTGLKWFVEGDIKGCFDNINHHRLLKILQKTIADQKFLRLIGKFLKCGYAEDWKVHKTYSGTPQGGIMSPILANIYLNEFDMFMEELKKRFDKGSTDSQVNKAYSRRYSMLARRRKRYRETQDPKYMKDILRLEKEMLDLPYYEQSDKTFKDLKYVRYADDFLIGVIGSKEDCELIKGAIKRFMNDELDLELSEEKTLITHINKRAKFLGYEITKRSTRLRKNKIGRITRVANGNVELYIPHDFAQKWLLDARAISYDRNGKDWTPVCRYSLTNLSPLEIVTIHNSEIRGLYNYYKMAKNVHRQMSTILYGLEYSCLSTLARKLKSSRKKVRTKLSVGKNWGIKYTNKEGEQVREFFREPIERDLFPITSEQLDYKFNLMMFRGRTELEERLKAKECEICGIKHDIGYHIHHINKMKTIKDKGKKSYWMKEMIARNRKTLIVCPKCHQNIHNGSL